MSYVKARGCLCTKEDRTGQKKDKGVDGVDGVDGKGNEERACRKFVDCIRYTQAYCKVCRRNEEMAIKKR